MGKIGTSLADQFDTQVQELRQFIEQCPDDKWDAVCNAEGWTVGQLAEHVAGQFPLEMEFIRAAGEGAPFPGYSWDDVNGKNDSRAAKAKGVTKAAVLAQLAAGAASTSAYVRDMSDAALTRTQPLPLAGGAEVNAQALIEGGVLIDHVRGHLASMRSAM